jgi:hypothetical protein
MPPTDSIEALPFVVRPAATADDLSALSALRAEAYARHDYLPGVSDRLRRIDEGDLRATLLVAEDKEDGAIIGTIRVNSSLRGTTPVPEQLPNSEFDGRPFAYVDRFAARQGPLADIVALALIKAQWFCAYHEGVDWIVAAALPALARRYRMVGLRTLDGGGDRGRFLIPHLHNKPYEGVGASLAEMPANLRRTSRFLVPFFLEKDHPDILIEKPAGLVAHIAATSGTQPAQETRSLDFAAPEPKTAAGAGARAVAGAVAAVPRADAVAGTVAVAAVAGVVAGVAAGRSALVARVDSGHIASAVGAQALIARASRAAAGADAVFA